MNVILTALILALFVFSSVIKAEETAGPFLIRRVIPDSAGKLLFVSGQKQRPGINYKTARLSEPERMVVDIENAVLQDENGKKSISLNNKNLAEDIRIAQFSTAPDMVRIVITAKTPDILDKIRITPCKSGVIFEFEKIELAERLNPSIYRDRNKKNTAPTQEITIEKSESDDKEAILRKIKEKIQNNIIIKTVKKYDNRIVLSGTGIISVSEPFVLDSPDRVIFDIADAVLDSSGLIGTFALKNGDNARIAQFDAKTARVVIESAAPQQYTHAVSPDLQSIVISPGSEISFAEFPDSNIKAEVQDIKVIKDSDAVTKLTVISKKPIIHGIERFYAPDKLRLNLYNLKAPSVETLRSLEKTPQFHGIEVENTAWSISLNRSTTVESKLSLDGRMLKLTLTDNLPIPIAGAGPVKAKVIIDPGHGGYDPGAESNGIYEKDIVLDVSKRVKKYLQEMGFYVIMTRETDRTVSLKDRVELANRENPDVFLSIHANASNNPDIKGIETHWYTTQSRPLAMHVQDRMVNMLVTPDRGLKNSRFYVIRNTEIPAVLAEIGYMTNQVEIYQLMTEERREATAKSIADGILSYLKSKNTNSEQDGRKQL